jgi:hypothetical protein
VMRRITQGEADATSVFEPCFVLRAVSLLHRRGQEHPVFDLHSFRELCRPFAVGEAKIQRRIEIASALAKKVPTHTRGSAQLANPISAISRRSLGDLTG